MKAVFALCIVGLIAACGDAAHSKVQITVRNRGNGLVGPTDVLYNVEIVESALVLKSFVLTPCDGDKAVTLGQPFVYRMLSLSPANWGELATDDVDYCEATVVVAPPQAAVDSGDLDVAEASIRVAGLYAPDASSSVEFDSVDDTAVRFSFPLVVSGSDAPLRLHPSGDSELRFEFNLNSMFDGIAAAEFDEGHSAAAVVLRAMDEFGQVLVAKGATNGR